SVKKNLLLRIFVQGIKADYSDVLNLPEAIVRNVSRRYPGGMNLEWLEWLLLRGDERIIKGFHIKFGPSEFSRSGNAIMILKEEDSWGVPNKHASRGKHNFITDAIDTILSSNKLIRIFEKRMKNAF
ncbi:MAG: hypothetical protein ACW99A_21975, partial [Candidatus Kariarchaeaceae archaeon]